MKNLFSRPTFLALLLLAAGTGSAAWRAVLNNGAVSTLAGVALSAGGTDGAGAAARFQHPTGIAVDAGGNVYVADFSNHTIRKITPAGTVTTVAGQAGSPGSADGTGAAARFKYPYGVAVDAAGYLYVTDQYNQTIRKISPAGVVTTLAGRASYNGSADGIGAAARFNNPAGVAVDGSGTVYVADQLNHTIRKISPAGAVTTWAGQAMEAGSQDSTAGPNARFCFPAGIAVTPAGTVYVADQENRLIRQISPAGFVLRYAGRNGRSGSVDSLVRHSKFHFPTGVAVDAAGTVYVADRNNHVIRRIVPTGNTNTVMTTTLAGTALQPGAANAAGAAARFNFPAGLAVDAAGTLYVADQGNHTIRVVR